MANIVGIVKQLNGSAIAVSVDGTQRILQVGDEIALGESVVASSPSSNLVISLLNGKELPILGNDNVKIDDSVVDTNSFEGNTVADASTLQQAILQGQDLANLEETAAGGAGAGSGGNGGTAQLNESYFIEGGHYSNINADGRSLDDISATFAQAPNFEDGAGAVDTTSQNIDTTALAPTLVIETIAQPTLVMRYDDKKGYVGRVTGINMDKNGNVIEMIGNQGIRDESRTLGVPMSNDETEIYHYKSEPGSEIVVKYVARNKTTGETIYLETARAIADENGDVSVTVDTKTDKENHPEFFTDMEGYYVYHTRVELSENTTSIVSGKASEAGHIVVSDAEGNIVAEGDTDADGNYKFNTVRYIENGEKLSATITDLAGNTSEKVEATALAKDTVAPNAPYVVGIYDNVKGGVQDGKLVYPEDENGNILGKNDAWDEPVVYNKGGISYTNDNTPTIRGFGEQRGTVEVYQDGVFVATVRANILGNGYFEYTPSALSDGKHTFEFTAIDASGNRGEKSTLVVDVDTVNPAINSLNLIDNVGKDASDVIPNTNLVLTDGVYYTNDATPTLEFKVEDVNVVSVTINGTTILPDADGYFRYTPSSDLADGDHTFTITATDKVGNETTQEVKFNIDTTNEPTISVESDNGKANSANGAINDSTPTIKAIVEQGSTNVSIKITRLDTNGNPELDENGKEIVQIYEVPQDSIAADGTITYIPNELQNGDYKVSVSSTDKFGNYGETSTDINIGVDISVNVVSIYGKTSQDGESLDQYIGLNGKYYQIDSDYVKNHSVDNLSNALEYIEHTSTSDATFTATIINYGGKERTETNSLTKGNKSVGYLQFLGADADSIEYTSDGKLANTNSLISPKAVETMEGYVYMQKGKTYEFKVYVDDGFKMTIDGNQIYNVNRWSSNGIHIKNFVYTGETGYKPIEMVHFNTNGRSGLQLDVKTKDTATDAYDSNDYAKMGTKESGMIFSKIQNIATDTDEVDNGYSSVISGDTNLAAGEKVIIKYNGKELGEATIDDDGKYQLKLLETDLKLSSSDKIEVIHTATNTSVSIAGDSANVTTIDADTNTAIQTQVAHSVSTTAPAEVDQDDVKGFSGKYYQITTDSKISLYASNGEITTNYVQTSARIAADFIANGGKESATFTTSSLNLNKTGSILTLSDFKTLVGENNVTDSANTITGTEKVGVITMNGYIFLEAGASYKFTADTKGSFRFTLDGLTIFSNEYSNFSFKPNTNTTDDSINDGNAKRDGMKEYSVTIEKSGFYPVDIIYTDAGGNTGLNVKVSKNGATAVTLGTGDEIPVVSADHLAYDSVSKQILQQYKTTITGEGIDADDGTVLNVYQVINGTSTLVGTAEVKDGSYSYDFYSDSNSYIASENFKVEFETPIATTELKVYDASDVIDESTDYQLVSPITGNGYYQVATLDTSIDFDRIANLGEDITSLEKMKLGDNIKLENLDANDVLDMIDNKDTILKIEGNSDDTISGQGWTKSADQSGATNGYVLYEGFTSSNETIKIEISQDIKTDFS
ncbi:retention module-containing protein [Campylobacter sp. faydin G-140]|uniref:retention module-containing protein n=1 Tax=Campylobacter anatolicus TaxID=2829105 RepID=UPI001B9189EF|nr:retention module-containing protein [Campylobacter anatolicus]MBR8465529.1 retention module-containing protein [Campylobacter anatolicus]